MLQELSLSFSDFVGIYAASGSCIVKSVSHGIASLKPHFIKMPETQQKVEIT